jgi:hypothetical protein
MQEVSLSDYEEASCASEEVSFAGTCIPKWKLRGNNSARMAVVKDITGLRFGRLTVIRRKGSERRAATWLCRCDCGGKTIVNGTKLRLGRVRSCGCYARQIGLANATHGHLRHYRPTTEYSAWRAMISRCYRPGFANFWSYGGKGIRVCKRWRVSFAAFLADMGPKPEPHMFLCRIDKNGDYKPDNCEWSVPATAHGRPSSR